MALGRLSLDPSFQGCCQALLVGGFDGGPVLLNGVTPVFEFELCQSIEDRGKVSWYYG